MSNIVNALSFEEAKALLSMAQRLESRDHFFSDREICWMAGPHEVADGYFGGGYAEIYIHEKWGSSLFTGDEAKELVTLGQDPILGRNDETGPDYYGGP